MNKLLKNSSISLVLMVLISCVTQILTLMKSSIVAGTFGLSVEIDAYNFANSVVSFVFGLIAGGIPTVIIPSYIKKTSRENVDTFLTIVYGMLAFIVIILLIFRYQIIGIFTNRDEIFINIACNILVILLLSQYLMAITNITIAYFQCDGKYNVAKIINLLAQIVVVLYLILYNDISIYQYTMIISLGILLNFSLDLFIALKIGWRYKPSFCLKSQEVRKLLKMFIPILFSSSVYRISLFIDSTLASRFDVGKLTILSYSNQIAGIIDSVLIGNLLIFAYPKIVKKINEKRGQVYFWNQINLYHAIILFVIIIFFTVGKESITILFQYGLFDEKATISVFIGAAIYIFGEQNNVIRDLMYRYFYAEGDTKTPAINSFLVSLLNIAISISLVYIIGFYGVILGTMISSFISLIVIFSKFYKKIGIKVSIKTILKRYVKNLFIAFFTFTIVMISKSIIIFDSTIYTILFFGIETLIIFCILLLMFNKSVIHSLKSI